jgi:uncharacterized membrane protein
MEFNPEILKLLVSPFSWVIYEILAVILLICVIFDIVKKNKEKKDSNLFMNLLEVFGFILYAVIFENLGVIGRTYDYSLYRFMIFGVVPLSIPIFEAVIFYSAMQFAKKLKFPTWSIPFIVSFFGMMQDFTLDPVSVADKRILGGILQARWNWSSILHYSDNFFGIPFFNFSGWFGLMFYYTALILIGRKIYEKYNKKISIGILYVLLSAIIGVFLILSPINLFLLFAYPFSTVFGNRTAEIIMLTIISIVIIITLIINRKRKKILLKNNFIIWIVPVSMHLLDFFVAITLNLKIVYVPVIIFSLIHLGYIGFYSFLKK